MEPSLTLTKNKKYYSYHTKRKDKQNIIKGTKTLIINSLSVYFQQHQDSLTKLTSQFNNKSMHISNKTNLPASHLIVANNFFNKAKVNIINLQNIKKQLSLYMPNATNYKSQSLTIFHQFNELCQQSIYYLDNCDISMMSHKIHINTSIIKNKVLLCVFLSKFKKLRQNRQQLLNKIFVSFKINPANQFQQIKWEQYSKIRKFMINKVTNNEINIFLQSFIEFSQFSQQMFWIDIRLILMKLLHKSGKQELIQKIITFGKDKFIKFDKKILQNDFIWEQLVTLIFL